MSDQIMQCPVCEEWRHKSWFDVGERGCKQCQAEQKSYLDGLAHAVMVQAQVEGELKGEMGKIANEEMCPASITPTQWRVLHMIDRGLGPEAIAVNFGITTVGAIEMTNAAMESLLNVAIDRVNQKEELHGVTQANA